MHVLSYIDPIAGQSMNEHRKTNSLLQTTQKS